MLPGSQESDAGAETPPTATPKQKLIEFLKNSVAEEEYRMAVPVAPENAFTFVHRMRVALSRFREKVRDRGHVPKSFKVLFIKDKTQPIADKPDCCTIVLKKSTSGHEVDAEIDDIFEQVAGGKVVEL